VQSIAKPEPVEVMSSNRMETCRRYGRVTDNRVVFDEWLASMLFREKHHTTTDIELGKRSGEIATS